jgi:hypothetical protein
MGNQARGFERQLLTVTKVDPCKGVEVYGFCGGKIRGPRHLREPRVEYSISVGQTINTAHFLPLVVSRAMLWYFDKRLGGRGNGGD